MRGAVYFLIFLSFVTTVASEEPTCYSRFDYDEKMLMKLLKIDDRVEKFEEFIAELRASNAHDVTERRQVFEGEVANLRALNEVEVERQKNATAEIQQVADDAQAQLADVIKRLKQQQQHIQEQQQQQEQQRLQQELEQKQKKDKTIAFTVTTPVDSPTPNQMTFTTVVTNSGDGFDTSSGKFTAPVAGLYFFSLHITKKRSSGVDAAGCYIYLNGSEKVRVFVDPQDGATGADNGSYGASVSVFLDLAVDDVVTLSACRSAINMESWSTLSGFLFNKSP